MRWTLVLLLFALPARAEYAGRPLIDALRDLEKLGLRLIYSEDVVRPGMIVREEPRATVPRRILDELLREHGLRAQDGPRGTLVIVRDTDRTENAAEDARAPMPVTLAEITVTPSRFSLYGDEASGRRFLDRDDVRRLAHFADDVYRAIGRLPGATGVDLSARFNLRGGEEDEVLVLFDGAEIHDPFHMKDLFRAFSILDPHTIGSADVITGGYPSQYGGRMSGVIDLTTIRPQHRGGEAGLGLLQARLLSHGTFRDDRASWLASARYGYIRELIELLEGGEDIDPRYTDATARLEWMAGSSAVVSVHMLVASDRLQLREDAGSNIDAAYRDAYAWANLHGAAGSFFYGQSVLSIATLARDRSGFFGNESSAQQGRLEDHRDAQIVTSKTDASFDVSTRNLVKAGLTVRRANATYDYGGDAIIRFASHRFGAPPHEIHRAIATERSANEFAAYAAERVLLHDRVVLEAGLRVAAESHTPDGTRLSPRFNAAWAASPRITVRAAWGLFDQPQRIDELQIEDGVAEYLPAQRSEHRVIGLEHALGRIELYDKVLRDLRPRYENLYDRVLLFPELRDDRIEVAPDRGRARGVEALLRSDPVRPLSGWIGYTLARVTDRMDDRDVPRAWDQRHAVNMSLDWRHPSGWSVNVAGTFRSGWPTTPVVARVENGDLVSEPGPLRSERLSPYHRIDVRAARTRNDWELFVEIFNILGHQNAMRIDSFDYALLNGEVQVTPRSEAVLRFIPSFGFTKRW